MDCILGWLALGTTSACAENTEAGTADGDPLGNYLRVRGEYSVKSGTLGGSVELPLRARRIQWDTCWAVDADGTTSACAENTIGASSRPPAQRNYLRVRGEYRTTPPSEDDWGELPPRARRIPLPTSGSVFFVGTTSACAENTNHATSIHPPRRNYLRVRGEYNTWVWRPGQMLELPPRARRIHGSVVVAEGLFGTTSACAENTEIDPFIAIQMGNYHRERGEYCGR